MQFNVNGVYCSCSMRVHSEHAVQCEWSDFAACLLQRSAERKQRSVVIEMHAQDPLSQ